MNRFTSKWLEKHTGTKLPKRKLSEAAKAIRKAQAGKHHKNFESLWKQESLYGLFPFEKEFRFHEKRRYRFDYAWPNAKLALEIDGGIFMKKGGHTTGKGKRRDCQKDWSAVWLGWRVIRWTPDMITVPNCAGLSKMIFNLTLANTPIRFVSESK